MSLLSHQSYANDKTPLWLSNPVQKLVFDGTPQITLSNNNGVLNINGVPLEDVSNWYQYSALNSIILFGDPNNPDVLTAAGGNLYFNGEILAQAGQISNVSDWALYIAISNVNMNNNAISNLSGINGLAMSNYLTSNWSRYVALQDVNFCNFTLSNVSNVITSNVTGRTDLTLTAYEPLNPTDPADVNITAGGGNRGRVNITANSGLAGIQGEVHIVANGGVSPADLTFGGLVEITANTPVGASPTLTSAIKFSAAGINSYAGAIPSVGSLAGYNFIYGTLGVNICAGLPSILPNTPSTTYIYGTGGVNLESGFGSDVQVKDSDFGCRKIVPYYSALATVSNLVITGRSNLVLANQYVVLTMVNNIAFENSASITGLCNINNIPVSNYLTSNWSSFPAVSDVNMSNHNISNVANLQVGTINGSAYPPAIPNWSTITATQNVNFGGFSITNLTNINGIPYASGTNWSLYPALQNVDFCNFNVSNVSNLDVDTINGVAYNPNNFSNWSTAPAIQNVNMSNFDISNITKAWFGGVSIKQGANVGGSTTAGTETVQVLNSLGGTGNLRVEQLAFQNNGGAVNDTIFSQVLDALNPPRMEVATNVSAGNIVAYLSDLPNLVSGSYDIYVAPNGNDTTGTGTNVNPYLTIGRALTKRATISSSVEVSIQVASGTYTESFTITGNTYVVGVVAGEVRQPTNITGVITITGGDCGVANITLAGSVVCNNGGSVATMNGVNITSPSGDVAVTLTNGNFFMTECRVNSGLGNVNGIVGSAGTLNLRDVIISHSAGASAGAVVINGSCNTAIRQTYITMSSTSTLIFPIVTVNTTSNVTFEMNYSRLLYVSGATDSVGNKCCIQFSNVSGTVTANVCECMLTCAGAITGGTRIEAIQKSGAGTVLMTYGDLQCVSPAVFISPSINTTQLQRAKQDIYGCFAGNVTTTLTANTPATLTHNIIEVSGGLSLSGGNIVLGRAGNYEVSTSIQFDRVSGGTGIVYFWFRLNGVDVLRSGSQLQLAGNGSQVLGNIVTMISANAGDVLSVVIGSADPDIRAVATGSQTTPMVVPAIPSVITDVKLLM